MDAGVISNPFPGLRAFESSEAHLFFGRDGQSDELLRRLERTRFLAIVGTSGSGKSSLVRAGMLPALQSGYMASAGSHWRIALMRPGNDPIGNLARALAEEDALGQAPDIDASAVLPKLIETGLRRSSRGLIELTRQARLQQHENLLVIVDQFEEIFRFRRLSESAEARADQRGSNAAAAFVKLLLEAAHAPSLSVYVVLTMRSDFLGDCAQFRDLPEVLNDGQYLVPRMSRDQRREAIEGPIAVGGAAATPRLVQRLLNDLGDNPDQLPILQHALMRTWDKWKERGQPQQPLDLADYQAIGTMSDALSLHADEVYHALPDDESRGVAASLFKCLTEKGPDNREVRRPTKLEEIRSVAAADWRVVEQVVESFRAEGVSFLMPPALVVLTPETVIDISHESLVRLWGRLRDWVDEESRSAAVYLRLAQATALHQQKHVSLWRNPELGLGLQWRRRQRPNEAWARRYAGSFNEALSFLERSRRARTRKRVFGSALTLFVVLMSIAFGLINYWAVKRELQHKQQAEAEAANALAAQALAVRRESEAIARHLAAESASQRRLDVSLLLRKAAAKFDSTFRERATLISALQEHPSIVALLTPGHREVVDIAFSPNGKLLATLSADASVVLWDMTTLRQGAVWQAHQHEPTSMAYSPDGRFVAVGSREGKVVLWDVASGRQRSEELRASADIVSLVFTPDAALLAAGSEDGRLALWRTDDWGKPPVVLRDGAGKVMSIAVSGDGNLLAGGDDAGRVTLWDLSKRKRLPQALSGHRGIVATVAFGPNDRLASGGDDRRLILWDLRTMQQIKSLVGHQGTVKSIAFGPGDSLASGGADQALMLWDVRGKDAPVARLEGHQGHITRVSYSPDAKQIATASTDGTVIIWDITEEMRFGAALPGQHLGLSSAGFSPDGTLMVGGGRDDVLNIWNAKTPQLLHRAVKADQEWINAVAFSPDGKRFASAGHDGTVRFWDSLTGKPIGAPLKAHDAPVSSLAFSADGKALATGSLDQSVRLWDAATAQSLGGELRAHQDAVLSVAFSADGGKLASGSADASIILWDFATRQRIGAPLRGHRKAVTSLAFNPKQDQLAAGSDDETVTLWGVDSHKQLGEALLGHRGSVKAVAFSSDGKMLASGGSDNAVMLWDVDARRAHGKALRTRAEADDKLGIRAAISGLAFSPDAKQLLAVGWNRPAVLWDVDLHSWLRQACEIANRNLTLAEWRRFVPGKDYVKTCEMLPNPESRS